MNEKTDNNISGRRARMETARVHKAGSQKTRGLVLTGLIFALALILSIVENALPALPLPVPGVKFGLSNIAVMYALFFLKKDQAYSIAILKGLFVMVTRGVIAGILSISGGILSLTVMLVLMMAFKNKASYVTVSISGAVAHNLGQLIAVTFIYTGMYLWAYMPFLLVSGVVAGIVTATLLKFIIPAFERIG